MIRRRKAVQGFTLIELMIVVAIIAILTLIAVPKFGGIIRKANEAGTKGYLGAIRSAIRLYYMEMDQIYPASFGGLRQAGAKFLSGAIPVYTGFHTVTEVAEDLAFKNATLDTGHWGYVSAGSDMGYFWVLCTHPDSTGKLWSEY